jgi:hypothetical protein
MDPPKKRYSFENSGGMPRELMVLAAGIGRRTAHNGEQGRWYRRNR